MSAGQLGLGVRAAAGCCVALVCLLQVAWARTITVGPEGEFRRIADAARAARSGDTIEIAPGRYRGDVALWTQDDLTVRGMGEGVVLDAAGASRDGKAIWVVRGRRMHVSRLSFTGARVAEGNGAGIRLERGSLTVHECRFRDNQVGVLTADDPEIELRIEASVFADAPASGWSYPHLLYVGAIGRLTVEGSRFEDGRRAHLIKSRARESWIAYNRIDDGPNGEAAYELEFPNGGRVGVVGNVLGQSRRTSNPVVLAYGAEGQRWRDNTLDVYHNTFIHRGWLPAWFVRVWDGEFRPAPVVRQVNNVLFGLGVWAAGPAQGRRGNRIAAPWPAPEQSLDGLRLAADHAPAARLGPDEAPLRPRAEPGHPLGAVSVEPALPLMPGALQQPAPAGAGRRTLPWSWP